MIKNEEVFVNVKNKDGEYMVKRFEIEYYDYDIEHWLMEFHPELELIDCGDYEDMLWQVRLANLGCRRMLSADGRCDDKRYITRGMPNCWRCDIMKMMKKKYGKEA